MNFLQEFHVERNQELTQVHTYVASLINWFSDHIHDASQCSPTHRNLEAYLILKSEITKQNLNAYTSNSLKNRKP